MSADRIGTERLGHAVSSPHARTATDVLKEVGSVAQGLTSEDAASRLETHGPNALPRARPPQLWLVLLRQFRSPLIYVLLAATAVSMLAGAWTDAGFIFFVLLLNAVIGGYQEYGAARAALALQQLISARALVLRGGEAVSVNAETLVPGDVVLLESGGRVPADLRLLSVHNLSIDESTLTGESLPTDKQPDTVLSADQTVGERLNMAFAGTMVASGRGKGVVTATGAATELGRIAQSLSSQQQAEAPLLRRMERFARLIAVAMGLATIAVAVISYSRGVPLVEVFTVAVALAVAAIPEGLPVALTIALAIGMSRMSKRNVVVRRLVAVEALGSCTCIASDKTGTLTLNQLTVSAVQLPDQPPWLVTGEGLVPEGTLVMPQGAQREGREANFERLCRAVVLANEATLVQVGDRWTGRGDPLDVAMLVMAHKFGIRAADVTASAPEIDRLAYESSTRYAASLNRSGSVARVSVKGAVETLLPMCSRYASLVDEPALVADEILEQAHDLAAAGYRVLAVAEAPLELDASAHLSREHLHDLCFVGLVALSDPLRPEAAEAVEACHRAGITVAMVTGDHPATAGAIGRELGLVDRPEDVVSGAQLQTAHEADPQTFDRMVRNGRVFARIEPRMKLEIVRALQRAGHFVAVTGDGVNDAPALRAAEVGVAMGYAGTDVARETADLVITDDNFASIVGGIEEGRIAYANIRKVIFLVISTGAAELVLFGLALAMNLPLPLVAVQLLWLNLVTNGIQDVALAFEPGEGDELARAPRAPSERVFNRLMVVRVLVSAVVIGLSSFALFAWLLHQGVALDSARNVTLMLMVLFENVQVFNARSETRSVFRHNPLRNRLLLFGALGAQLLHIAALYTPGVRELLQVQPISLGHWLELLPLALLLLVVLEALKAFQRMTAGRSRRQ